MFMLMTFLFKTLGYFYADLSNDNNEAPTVAILSLPNAEETDALQQNGKEN